MFKNKTKNLNISWEEVKHVAELAKLSLKPQEIKKFQTQLSQVLEYVNQLSYVNTQGVEPTSQVAGLKNVMREDEVVSSLTQEENLSSAKQKEKGFFKIKAIF